MFDTRGWAYYEYDTSSTFKVLTILKRRMGGVADMDEVTISHSVIATRQVYESSSTGPQ